MLDDFLLDYPANANLPAWEPEGAEAHPSAILSGRALLEPGVRIGHYAVVGPNVVLKKGVHLASHVVVGGRTTVHEGIRIFPFTTLGATPQSLKSDAITQELSIGRRNTILDYASISGGSEPDSKTVISSDNLLRSYSHVSHDCITWGHCVLTNGVNVAGHTEIGNWAVLRGMSVVHQFSRIRELAMVSGGSIVTRDVPPLCLVAGDRARIVSLNSVGLRRTGYTTSEIKDLKKRFALVFRHGLTLEEAANRIEDEAPLSQAKTTFLNFLKTTRRGICR